MAISRFVPFFACALALGGPVQAGKGTIANPSGDTTMEINFRYPPTPQQLADAKAALNHMSEIICDATDGQVTIDEIRLTGGGTDEDQATFWFHASQFRAGGTMWTDGSGFRRLGSRPTALACTRARCWPTSSTRRPTWSPTCCRASPRWLPPS